MKYIEPWLKCPIVEWSVEGERSAEQARKVIAQFKVAKNPRYTPRDLNKDGKQDTFCNIFTWDYSRAMGCEIPHWVGANGAITAVGMGKELNANATVDWIREYGSVYGWRKITENEAREAAGRGYPTVVLWQHHGGIGHVAVVYPSPKLNDVTLIAQAGSKNFEGEMLKKGFGRLTEPALEFWTHL